jgi:hypothetical protein
MSDEIKIITPELLKSWNPCIDGFNRFCELFPQGADLGTAITGLINDNHDNWGYWLFEKCREKKLFNEIVLKGYRNSGDWNSGNWNSGYRNSGDWNSGDRNSGDWNSGNWNSGDWNSGDRNSGNWNSGYRNSGYRNSGDWNSGDWNSGYRNSGDRNSGDRNSGDRNSGDRNSGDRNSGNWNSGDWNSGFFNTNTPDKILIFNKLCEREIWEKAYKPVFLFFKLTYWVNESEMTDEDKAADPNFYVRCGQLKKRDYKEAFKLSWDKADKEDRIKVKELPNFDAKIFFEISGINVDEEQAE